MITFAEYLNLDWGDFTENAGGILRDLREDQDFCDVTLVCEDNQQIPCHRVILATSSPLLKAMIRSSQHSHPMIYFMGVKARDLARMVDFIYKDRVQVYQSDLTDFLTLAEMLKVKGVSGNVPRLDTNSDENYQQKENTNTVQVKNKTNYIETLNLINWRQNTSKQTFMILRSLCGKICLVTHMIQLVFLLSFLFLLLPLLPLTTIMP